MWGSPVWRFRTGGSGLGQYNLNQNRVSFWESESEPDFGSGALKPLQELCPALISLVFLLAFFSLALVFNVLYELQKMWRTTLYVLSSPMFCTNALHCGTDLITKTSLAENINLTTGTPSGAEDGGLVFRFTWDTKSKREKIKKPCNKTTQFFVGLHCQAHKRRRLELIRRCLTPHDLGFPIIWELGSESEWQFRKIQFFLKKRTITES